MLKYDDITNDKDAIMRILLNNEIIVQYAIFLLFLLLYGTASIFVRIINIGTCHKI